MWQLDSELLSRFLNHPPDIEQDNRPDDCGCQSADKSEHRDFQDFGCSGTQSSRRVDSQTVEILRKCANGGWTRFVRRLAAQPKDLVLEITEHYADGRRFERHLILEKQTLEKR